MRDTGTWQQAFADDGSGDWREKWFLDGDTATVEAHARLVAEATENLRAFIAGERRNRVD